ncbi:hypothetical protein VTH06DRAFT_5261 [Thermothelomyces fergusii]
MGKDSLRSGRPTRGSDLRVNQICSPPELINGEIRCERLRDFYLPKHLEMACALLSSLQDTGGDRRLEILDMLASTKYHTVFLSHFSTSVALRAGRNS